MPWTIWQESGARRLGQVANPERSVEMSRSLLHKITTVEVPVADLSRSRLVRAEAGVRGLVAR
jgi:hypothetical protein